MSNHYPECPAGDCGCSVDEECGPTCRHRCICPALRACTTRVLGEARAAVAAEDIWPVPSDYARAHFLAAIDRLAEEAP